MNKKELIIKLENEYKKIGFFKRIFSWNFILKDIINNIEKIDTNYDLDEEKDLKLKNKVSQMQDELSKQKSILERQKNEIFNKEEIISILTEDKKKIEDEKNKLNIKYNDISINEGKKETELNLISERQKKLEKENEELIKKLKISERNIVEKEQQVSILKEKEIKLSENKSNLESQIVELRTKNTGNEKQIEKLEKEKSILETEIKKTNSDIKKTTDEIHRIFTRTSGARGKIAELRLENILQSNFGDPGEYWIKNLQAGSVSGERVEFGIRYNEGNLWIPVDSKALIPKERTSEGDFLIDQKYVNSIKTEISKIKKYISKKNTTDFALLVLPNDEFFMKLNESYPEIFDFSTTERVYITSPTNITQFVNTISQLQEKINLVNRQSGVINELNVAYKHFYNFSNSVEDGVKKLNIAFEKHIPKAKKKLEEINNSIKSIPENTK